MCLRTSNMKMVLCAGCDSPILDRFLSKVEERAWHAKCVKCWDCQGVLADKCFSREGKLFCRTDFFRRFGPKCGACGAGLLPTDLVRRARGRAYHVACFTCLLCRKQPSTGEELYVLEGGTRFLCKDDFHRHRPVSTSTPPPLDSPDFDEGEPSCSPVDPGYREVVSGGSGANSPPPSAADPPPTDCDDEGASGGGGAKRRGPRTTIKAKQLETLKAAFAATPKPTRHIREQLAQETGLNMRVIQVWFQNRRSKERRMKQLSSLGARRHFFRNPRRAMRPLRADEGMPHAPFASYFSDSNSPNDFNYPPHPGFYDYFPGHHPHGGISDFPGTVPLQGTNNPPADHPINNGVLGSEAPFPDCLGPRSSPENVLSSGGFGPRTDPFPPHLPETRVW